MIDTVDAHRAELPRERASGGARSRRSTSSASSASIGGDIFHGALALDQLFSARPVLGTANYRDAGARAVPVRRRRAPGRRRDRHPGHNAAREILRDARRTAFAGASAAAAR